MSPASKKIFVFLFSFIVAMVLIANVINSFTLDIVFKPLIVISLLVYIFLQKSVTPHAVRHAIAGLLFSLIGDVLLIFQGAQPLFFIGGLISFLLAHISYIVYYVKSSNANPLHELKLKWLLFLVIICYGVIFYFVLFESLGALKIPVFVYTTALVSMNILALNRYGKVTTKSFRYVFAGALCFTLSDSLLAINKFLCPLPLAGVWIIASYAIAQYLITEGVLGQSEK